jgi:hypothetical protein
MLQPGVYNVVSIIWNAWLCLVPIINSFLPDEPDGLSNLFWSYFEL